MCNGVSENEMKFSMSFIQTCTKKKKRHRDRNESLTTPPYVKDERVKVGVILHSL